MTRVWIAFGLLAVIFILAFTEYNITVNTSDNITALLEETEISAKNNSAETKRLCGDIKKLWEGKKTILAIFLSHKEIENINISIDQLKKLCEKKEYEKVYVECATLSCLIESLKESEKVSLHNIL